MRIGYDKKDPVTKKLNLTKRNKHYRYALDETY